MADLELDIATRTVRRGGIPLELTSREFELIEYLLRHVGQLVSREMLTRTSGRNPAAPPHSIMSSTSTLLVSGRRSTPTRA